jgi:hypothetical protein
MKKIPIYRYILVVIAAAATFSCMKQTQPPLPPNYPTDTPVTPTTPLRFYLSFDSTSPDDHQLNIRFKDSISAYPSFFPDPSITYGTGVRGTAFQGNNGAFIHYVNANDFGNSTSFSIAFWLKATLAQKDHVNADGILSLPSSVNFWSNVCIFADHEPSTSDSMALKFHFANGTGDNWDFQYAGAGRVPKIYDGNWHQIVFTYDATAKTGILYRDGVQFDKKTNETIAFDGKVTGFMVGGFQQMMNLAGKWSDNSWQSGWGGSIDQVRLYNTVLAPADVTNLYNNKQ